MCQNVLSGGKKITCNLKEGSLQPYENNMTKQKH